MPQSLNDISAEQLAEITQLANLFFTHRQVAIMLELPVKEFIEQCLIEGSVINKAYESGFLQGEVDLRRGILKMAKAGSSPAQTMALDLLNKAKAKLLDR
jgi:hypothetical protein